jgi:hypothetical protein
LPDYIAEMTLHPLIPNANQTNQTGDDRLAPAYLDPQLLKIRQWQAARLASTHKDLLTSSECGAACRFFLSDVYGPHDFRRRDQDIRQVYTVMGPLFPLLITETLELVIAVNDLTLKLDEKLLEALVGDLPALERITVQTYGEAYRRCDNYDERKRQIDLLIEAGHALDQLVHKPLVALTLRLAHEPATWLGWGELQDFLERGYTAFRQLADAERFLQIIEQRERQILDQLFAGLPNPFQITET